MGRGHRAWAAALVGAGLLASCGGEAASITTEDQAREAVVATVRDSWTAELRVDLELTDAHLDAILDTMVASDTALGVGEAAAMSEMFGLFRDQAATSSSVLAHGEDGSLRFASLVDDAPLLDLRLDVDELVAMDTLTPDATVYLQADVDGFLQQMRDQFAAMAELDPAAGDVPLDLPGVAQLRQQVQLLLPAGPVRDMVLAILDGGFGGATGTLDLAALGATAQDLAEMRDELSGDVPIDGDDLAALADAALAFGDLTTADGVTTTTVDLRPRAALEAAGRVAVELGEVEDAEAYAAEFESATGTAIADLPETVPGIATLTFDAAGHLHTVTVPLLDIARTVIALLPDAPPEATRLAQELDGARYDLVVTVSEVGQVDTVLDVDAVEVSWEDLVELAEQFGMEASR